MNITTKGRYALRVMLDMAQHPEEKIIPLKAIAERQGISVKYLELIVCTLRQGGLLESARGKDGGYGLRRSPEEYTVGEILQCVEDSLAPVACIKDGVVRCDQAEGCITLPMWQELDELTNNYLSSITLADLLSGEKWRARS